MGIAFTLTPAMLAEVPKGHLAGVVSVNGSANSHASILTRAMGIPAIWGIEDLPLLQFDGKPMILDAFAGRLYISPSQMLLDEYADLIEEDTTKKREIESLVKRLSQKARAAGIHLIVATQKPVVEVINTVIKSNLPATLALKVKNRHDSAVILGENGAEVLTGRGDSLYKNGSGSICRVQCAIKL